MTAFTSRQELRFKYIVRGLLKSFSLLLVSSNTCTLGLAGPQVESQRLLLWASRVGKAEELMTALNARHFERRQSVNTRAVLLDAVDATEGLDATQADTFLNTSELEDEVSVS